MYQCPCCGHTMEEHPALDNLKELPELTAMHRIILDKLIQIYPRGIDKNSMVSYMYSGAREPDTSFNVLGVNISQLRKRLGRHGWTIPKGTSGRGHQVYYRLEKIK